MILFGVVIRYLEAKSDCINDPHAASILEKIVPSQSEAERRVDPPSGEVREGTRNRRVRGHFADSAKCGVGDGADEAIGDEGT